MPSVHICEVGPRDGLQNAKHLMPTAAKKAWIQALAAAGLREIEVGSFVPARLLPQLADTGGLVTFAKTLPGLFASVLIPNLRGAERALEIGADLMLVPLSAAQVPSRGGTDERIDTPGAVTSGLNWSPTGVGPLDEKYAIRSLLLAAAAVIAAEAVPGEPIEPRPTESNSFPAATVVTTPALAAPAIACTTRSRLGSMPGSPTERLITSIPSATAASTAAAISGLLPSIPNSGVGAVNTL